MQGSTRRFQAFCLQLRP